MKLNRIQNQRYNNVNKKRGFTITIINVNTKLIKKEIDILIKML